MSVTTIRPTSTTANGTSTIGGGAGSRHAALSDDSATTYVDVTGGFYDAVSLGFTDPAPSGTILAAIARMEASAEGGFLPAIAAGMLVAAGGDAAAGSFNIAAQGEYQGQGAWGDGSSLLVAIWNAGGSSTTLRLYELFLDVYYVAVPTVDATGPTGTLTETNRPTITWNTTFDEDGQGVGPSDFQVRVFTDAVYGGGGFDAATSTAVWETDRAASPTGISGSVRVLSSLANDTYRAYVRAKDSISGWGSWDYAEFTVSVTPPDAPAISLSSDATHGRVEIAVTPDNSPVATDGIVVERSRDGGTTWESVLEDAGGSTRTLYDYFVPSGLAVSYRACAWNDTDEDRLYSSYTTDSITPDLGWWIKSFSDASLNFSLDDRPNVYLRGLDSISRAARQSISQPLGRDDAVVISDTYGPETGDVTFLIHEQDNLDDLNALLDTLAPLYLTGPEDGVGRDRWVVFGDASLSRLIDRKADSPWEATLPWTEVASPEGS